MGEPQGGFDNAPDLDFEGDGGQNNAGAPSPDRRSDELGNSRGKRMAMKFVNKIANKEKYTQVRTCMLSLIGRGCFRSGSVKIEVAFDKLSTPSVLLFESSVSMQAFLLIQNLS